MSRHEWCLGECLGAHNHFKSNVISPLGNKSPICYLSNLAVKAAFDLPTNMPFSYLTVNNRFQLFILFFSFYANIQPKSQIQLCKLCIMYACIMQINKIYYFAQRDLLYGRRSVLWLPQFPLWDASMLDCLTHQFIEQLVCDACWPECLIPENCSFFKNPFITSIL